MNPETLFGKLLFNKAFVMNTGYYSIVSCWYKPGFATGVNLGYISLTGCNNPHISIEIEESQDSNSNSVIAYLASG